jgi:signal transduction histidine kinase
LLPIDEKYEFLRKLPVFSESGQDVLSALVEVLKEKEVLKGSVIIRKGDEADAAFFIAEGSVRVHDGNHVLARLGKGQLFGEYALIDKHVRSASVTADENCLLLRLDNEDFYRIAAGNTSVLQGVLRALITRMREMNELEEKLSRSYLKIQRQKELIQQQAENILEQKEQLEQHNFDLLKVNEEKNQIISMVIHQIKNPLTSSLCMTEMLDSRDESVDETEREGLAIIRNSLRRINNLVNEILDVSAIDSKVFQLKTELMAVDPILEELISNYRYFIEQKEIRLIAEVEPVKARLNRVYITQIMDNLISNAVKFTLPGKSIRIRLSGSDGLLLFNIEDEGPGFDASKGNIFELYRRQTGMTEQNKPAGGLGLAIVNKYTTAMGGSIRYESVQQKGTKFFVELPAGS